MNTPDPVDNVLGRLEGVRRSGEGWEARCPAHDDRRASLTVNRGSDGRVLLHCHAGCEPASVAGALGLELRDLFPPDSATPQPGASRRREAAAYPYRDEKGTLLYEAVRYEPKDFRPRLPDGRYTLKGVRRVLYRLPEVLAAVREGETVFVVEGEKDADNLARLGCVATCNVGGAEKWSDDYSATLRGATVVILPDNDEPGRAHAAKVERSLRGLAAEVRVLELPGLSPKGDVSDWIAAGGDRAALLRLLGSEEAPTAPDDSPIGDSLPRATCALGAPVPPPPKWSAARLFTQGDLGLLTSDGGVGKSTFAIAVSGAIAAGRPVFDHAAFSVEQGPVLYVSEEDPAALLLNRLDALIEGHGWDYDQVRGHFHFFAQEGVSLDSPSWRAHLLAEAKRLGVRFIVLDPYAELTAAKENDNDSAKPIIKFARQLGSETGATVLIIHHAGKIGDGKRKLDRIRGASALNAAARCIYFLDNTEAGIAVECLKLTKAERLPPFVVSREVEQDPANPAVWRSARLRYATQREATDSLSDRFVIEALERTPGLITTELKELAKTKEGVAGADVSGSLSRLQTLKVIGFEPGKRGAKHWHLTLPARSGKVEKATLPACQEVAGQGENDAGDLATPFRGQGKVTASSRQGREVEEKPDPLSEIFDEEAA